MACSPTCSYLRREFVSLSNAQVKSSIVYLNVQMNPQLGSTEPLCRVCVEADDVFTWNGGSEGEPALAAVNLQPYLALYCVGGFISLN